MFPELSRLVAGCAGVAQLAYTGVLRGSEADFDLAADHAATEQLIPDSGLPYTFLRSGWYTEDYIEKLAPVLKYNAVSRARARAGWPPPPAPTTRPRRLPS
jgi:NAD(P)H dehydrogenase (quinone)